MRRSPTIALLFVAGTFVAAGLALALGGAAKPAALQGKPAPAFTLKTPDGKSLSLADQKGKVVLIDTWATWCPPCRASLPHIQKLSEDKTLTAKGLVVWAVNSMEPKNTIDAFMTDNKYTFTVPMDSTGNVLRSYNVEGIPTTFIVGRDGTIKDTFVGYGGDTTAKQIDAALAKALAEPAPK